MRFGKRLLFWLMVAFTATPLYAQIGQPGVQPGPSSVTSPTFTGDINATGGVFTGATPLCLEGATANAFETCITLVDPTGDNFVNLPDRSGDVFLTPALDPHVFYVDSAHYLTVDAALDAITTDANAHAVAGEYLETNYIINIEQGTYSDPLTIPNAKNITFRGVGVTLSGLITWSSSQQGGDYYSRLAFEGIDGFRAEKGPAFKIEGNIAAERNNDSLIYLTLRGVWMTGTLELDGDGTLVAQFFKSRMTGEITTATLTSPASTVLIESDWTEFTGLVSNKVSLYNIHNTDFYGAINTTPWYASRVVDSDFHSTVSIIPQGGAAETTVYFDPPTRATLPSAAVFTGVTLVDLAGDPFPLNRVYVVDPTWGPYRTVKAALDQINVAAAAESSYLDTNYTIKIHPGTYADNLAFTNYKHLRLEAVAGYVELSGTLTFTQSQQGGDYYSRVEFAGIEGFRAEKGPAFKISGAMSGTRNNDSLTYFTFKGIWITGNFSWDGDGTPVVQFFGCRMNGTIDSVTFTSPASTILVEADWTEFATGSITDKVSLYNVRNSDFYGAITTTPWYGSTFFNTGFHSTVSIIPQGGAAETTINLDGNSFKSLAIQAPTLTGATVVNMDLYSLSPTIPDSGGVGAATYTLEARGAESAFLTCADADGCTVTMGEEMTVVGQKLTIVNLGVNDVTLVDDDGTTAELDGDANYAMDVQLESVSLIYLGAYWLQTGFLDPS